MHPNTTRHTKTWVYGPMGMIRCVHFEKFRCDFVARTFALIALVQPVLYQASCNNETIQNTSKHYKKHQNMSYGPMVWIGCICCKKFRCDFVARTLLLIAPVQPVLQQASCSNETIHKTPKHYETHQNMSLGSNGADRVLSLWQIPMWLHGTNLCINCTKSTRFPPSFM